MGRNERTKELLHFLIDSQRTRTTRHKTPKEHSLRATQSHAMYTKDAQWQFNEASHDKWLMGFFSLFFPFIFYSRFIFLLVDDNFFFFFFLNLLVSNSWLSIFFPSESST